MEDFNVAPVTNRRGGNGSWFCIVCVSIDWRSDPKGLRVSTSMDKGNPRPIVQTISRWQSENRGGSWCWAKSCGTIIQTHLKTETEQPLDFLKSFSPSTVCPAWEGWPEADLGRPQAQRAEKKGFATLINIKKHISAEMSSLDNGKLRPFTSLAHTATGVPPVTR